MLQDRSIKPKPWGEYVRSLGAVHLIDHEKMKDEWKRRIQNRRVKRELLQQAAQRQAGLGLDPETQARRKAHFKQQEINRATRKHRRWKSFSGPVTVTTNSKGAATIVVDDAQAEQCSTQAEVEPGGAGAGAAEEGAACQKDIESQERRFDSNLEYLDWLDQELKKTTEEVTAALDTSGKEE